MSKNNTEQTIEREFCAYTTDLPFRLIETISKILGIVLEKTTFGIISRTVTPFTIWLSVFLTLDIVVIIYATTQGYLEFLSSPFEIAHFGLMPIAIAIAYRFYQRLFPALDELYKREIIAGKPAKFNTFKRQLNDRLNSRIFSGISLGLGMASYFFIHWGIELLHLRTGFPEITETFHRAIQGYAGFWSVLGFSLAYFLTYKIIIIWLAIKALSKIEQPNELKPHFSVDLYYPDGCGGFKKLSLLWLHVNFIVLMAGIGIGIWGISNNWNLSACILAVVYIVLGPVLFYAPFGTLHTIMQTEKEKELENYDDLWKESKKADEHSTDGLIKFRERYMEIERLPTWPINWTIGRYFWSTFIVPIILTGLGQYVKGLIDT